ncbi:MAG TPA: S-layer homology domain-containing protein [Thermoanaerobaculia bacterium]|nr:S-layer homology domain-containing protein [Thermoanaerobaculia bacterium]
MREWGLRRCLAVAAIVVTALCLAARSARATTTWVVTASGNDMDTAQFTPKFLTIQVGDTVQWVNHDGVHNVVADDGTFLSGTVQPPTGPAWPFSVTFTKTGTNPYYCEIHGNIGGVGQSGVIFVRPAHPANEIVLEKGAFDFEPVSSALATDSGPEFGMRHGNGTSPTELATGVSLPAGSKIAGIEITGCDDSDTLELESSLFECPDPTGECTRIAGTSSSGKPGCDFFSTSLADGPVINNLSNTYLLDIFLGPDQDLRFRNVRLFYKKVLSPAPLTATFADVPTSNQFFKVIEALAASGITQGCGNGNFCPNDPVTRGSMASFLARALGLFFPN